MLAKFGFDTAENEPSKPRLFYFVLELRWPSAGSAAGGGASAAKKSSTEAAPGASAAGAEAAGGVPM